MSFSVIMMTEGCKGKISEPENAAIQTEETINEVVRVLKAEFE